MLLASAGAFLEAVSRRPHAWRLILLPVEGTPSAVIGRVERGRDLIRRQIQDLVEWGLEQRGGPKELEPELAAYAIVALGEQAARLLIQEPERFTPDRLARNTRVLMRALSRD